ncbi:hypothetical protein F4777DRAFT_65592 [Nemania sp. FL0916]|nr:hypothetical protein F4777DRAFT_65592 [Nemania sp. FL0916]
MTIPPDPYKILGVASNAQVPEIRTAYRKLVLKCHPDKIQDPALKEEKQVEFQQVQQAYELLTNDAERDRYDRNADIYEHQREWARAKASAPKAAPPTPKQETYFYNVKEASPRTSTFAKSSPYGRTPPRSYEDTTTRGFEEPTRHARKTASYEKERPSKRDDDRRRRREEEERARDRDAREARKARERKEEKDRVARDREEREKEKRKEEKKKAHSDREKEREKERKRDAAEKHRSRQNPIIEEEDSDSSASSDDDDVIYETQPRPDRKKSSGARVDDIEPPLSTSIDRTRKYSGNMESAVRYLERSSGKPVASFGRSQTYTEGSKVYGTPMVPTPPPAANLFPKPPAPPPAPYAAEPEEMSEDEGMARRSSARPTPRRMSQDTPRSSREKASSHKKSSSSRDHQPIIVEAGSPPVRTVPHLSRAQTDSFPRPIPINLSRGQTWYPTTERERERHERSRSRASPPTFSDEDSEDERDRHPRRSRRTKSPEPAQVRYNVDSTGTPKTIPIRQKQYHEQPLRGSYKTKGSTYITPNSSARLQRSQTSYARDYYAEDRPQHFSGVEYAQQFKEGDIRYSKMPYKGSSYRDVYT